MMGNELKSQLDIGFFEKNDPIGTTNNNIHDTEKNMKDNQNGITDAVVIWSPEQNDATHELSLKCSSKTEGSPFRGQHE